MRTNESQQNQKPSGHVVDDRGGADGNVYHTLLFRQTPGRWLPGELEFAEYAAFFRLRVHGFYSPAFLRRGLAFRLLEDSPRRTETKSITFVA